MLSNTEIPPIELNLFCISKMSPFLNLNSFYINKFYILNINENIYYILITLILILGVIYSLIKIIRIGKSI